MVPLLLLIAVSQTPAKLDRKHFIGTYEVVMFSKGRKIDNASLPPGQVRFAELKSDGTWIMRDFLSGIDGTWRLDKGKVVLIALQGPAGKLKEPDTLTFAPRPDRGRLVLVGPRKVAGQLEWRYNPRVLQKWEQRMKDQARKFGIGG